MSRFVCLIALVATLVPVEAEQAAVTPVQKVIQLMNGMVAKGKKEKHQEQVQFAAFKQFCDDTTAQKQKAIKEANENIEVLKADIQKYEADAADLAEDIAASDEDVTTWKGDMKASTRVREIENTDYLATHKDYTESIEALEAGIATLKKQSHDVKQSSAALVQLSALKIPAETRRAFDAFLSSNPMDSDENLAVSAPEANAFEFQSGGILDMITKLQEKFEGERTELEKQETNAKNSFDMLMMDLNTQIEQATASSTEKSEAKAKAVQAAAEATGGLADTTKTAEDDSKYLADLSATCAQKATAFAQRQTTRAEEIEAINKAIEILSSGAVAGNADKHLPKFVQVSGHALVQLRSDDLSSPVQLRVAAYLQGQADQINSRVLAALSVRVTADPMRKVKKMIKDLIVKLMEEANEEAEKKGFCDTEMSTNEQTRTEKSQAVETLTAEIEELQASIAKLTEEATTLTAAVAAGQAALAKATTTRNDENTKNTATIKDAQEAQTAVAQALSVLKEFYDKAATKTSFVQQPEVFDDEPYKGMGGESGGVVGMIEVIQSDFARLESETTTAESQGQAEYDQFVADTNLDNEQMKSDIEHAKSTKQNQEQAVTEKQVDLDGTSKELTAALAYWDKLKPSCIDAVESYEDRVARRKAEIESLKEALTILSE